MEARNKAHVGKGVKGQGYGGGYIAVVAASYWSTKERLGLMQIQHDLDLFKAKNDGKGPKTHDEFMQKIIKEGAIKLPELPPGQRYQYGPPTETLMILKPADADWALTYTSGLDKTAHTTTLRCASMLEIDYFRSLADEHRIWLAKFHPQYLANWGKVPLRLTKNPGLLRPVFDVFCKVGKHPSSRMNTWQAAASNPISDAVPLAATSMSKSVRSLSKRRHRRPASRLREADGLHPTR